jgi:hypothetical protein
MYADGFVSEPCRYRFRRREEQQKIALPIKAFYPIHWDA